MILFGPPNIEKLKARNKVSRLIRLLHDRHPVKLRARAARALGDLGDDRAVEPLIALLQERHSSLGIAAAQALGKLEDPRAIEPLIALLLSKKSQSARLAAAHALGQIGASNSAATGRQIAKALVRVLRDRDSQIRRSTVRALSEIGTPAAEPLTAALQDRRRSPAAIQALTEIGTPAVEPVLDSLDDEQGDVRRAKAALLGEVGTQVEDSALYERIGQALISLLEDPGQNVRAAAAKSLARLKWEPQEEQARIAYYIHTAQWDRCIAMGIPAILPLVEILRNGTRRARADAIGALGDLIAQLAEPSAREQALGPLVDALADEALSVRTAAAEALNHVSWQPDGAKEQAAYWAIKHEWDRCVEIGAPAASFVALALDDSLPSVRQGAAASLGEIATQERDGKIAEPLFALLDDKSQPVRQTAISTLAAAALLPGGDAIVQHFVEQGQGESLIEALNAIGDARAVDRLIPLLENPERGVRRAAAAALGEIADERAVEPLNKHIREDKDYDVRKTAVTALGQIGTASAIAYLVSALDTRQRDTAAEALRQTDGRGIERLIDRVTAIRPNLEPFRYDSEAIRALGDLGDERAIELLRRLLRHEYECSDAAEALVRIGSERAVDALIEALNSGRASRKAAARALGRMKVARAAQPLLRALDHEDRGVRRFAAEALVKLYHHAALDDETKKAILAQRERITAHHTDQDHENDKGC